MKNTTHIPASPLRYNAIDEYESGMEASASSMAEDDDEIVHKKQHLHKKSQAPVASVSSSTSSVDESVATKNSSNSAKPTHLKDMKASPLRIITPSTARLLQKTDEVPTPSSGYDGDTEGPLNDDTKNYSY
ncbi:hypothetical protein RMATCC62417_01432 [Rhizopus microsporus]|nr:hypothetical protein RMATCC62417_01432 [Rhizopus microsporus]CEJ04947.1 hypothetical protein RMCBS344292_18895 [Rhizopus microsporus]